MTKSNRCYAFCLVLLGIFASGAAEAVPMSLVGPTNNLTGSGSIEVAGETDEWLFKVVSTGTVTITGVPDSTLQLNFLLEDPMDVVIAAATAPAPGSDIGIFNVNIAKTGIYTLTVSGASGTTGAYSLLAIGQDGASITGVPEPTTIALMGLGLAGIGFARKRMAV